MFITNTAINLHQPLSVDANVSSGMMEGCPWLEGRRKSRCRGIASAIRPIAVFFSASGFVMAAGMDMEEPESADEHCLVGMGAVDERRTTGTKELRDTSREGFTVTHFITVADIDRSADFL